jgi:hypothetical protein
MKPWLTLAVRKEITDMVKAEVKNQLAPVLTEVSAVKAQNEAQFRTLGDTQSKVKSIDDWKDKLWGNGLGKDGFLDKARKEDKEQLIKIQAGFDNMQNHLDVEKVVTARVAEALAKETAKQAQVVADVATKRDRKFNRTIAVLSVFAALFGGGLLVYLFDASKALGH